MKMLVARGWFGFLLEGRGGRLRPGQVPAYVLGLILLAVSIELPELEEGRYIADKMKVQAEAALVKAKEVALEKGLDSRGRTL